MTDINLDFNPDSDGDDNVAENNDTETTATTSRPFSVKTKNTKQKYTFKNFTSARQGTDIFTESAGSLQEKSELYDAVAFEQEELKETLAKLEKETGVVANGETIVALVPISFITIDPDWCRQKRVDWNHVAEIVVNFRPGSLSLPTITFRKIFTQAGKLQDVVISLTDGVHRTVSLRELGYTHVRALVQIVEEMKDEAQIYSDCNYNRRVHAKRDIYRARVAREDAALMEIVSLVEKYGFRFPKHAGMRSAWPDIGAIQTVEKLYYRYGPETLGRTLELMSDPVFSEWHGQPASITADMLAGWCMFIDKFEKPGFVHSNMTEYLLRSTTPTLVTDMANSISREACDGLMGEEVCKNSATFNSQEARAIKHCCALLRKVRDLFKPSKRPAGDFLPKFKDAFDLFYSKDEHRMAELMHLRRFFAKKKMADHWFAKVNSEIVR